MNIKQKMQLHDRLYKRADRLIKKHNPCKIKGKTCLYGKQHHRNGINSCCNGCKYLGKSGCTVESLMCKLHLCYTAAKQSPKLSRMLGRLTCQTYGYSILLVRGSRKDVAKQLKLRREREEKNGL